MHFCSSLLLNVIVMVIQCRCWARTDCFSFIQSANTFRAFLHNHFLYLIVKNVCAHWFFHQDTIKTLFFQKKLNKLNQLSFKFVFFPYNFFTNQRFLSVSRKNGEFLPKQKLVRFLHSTSSFFVGLIKFDNQISYWANKFAKNTFDKRNDANHRKCIKWSQECTKRVHSVTFSILLASKRLCYVELLNKRQWQRWCLCATHRQYDFEVFP